MVFCRNSHSELPNHGFGARDARIHEYGVGISNVFLVIFSKISTHSEGWNQYMHDLYVNKGPFCFEVDAGLVLWHIRGALSTLVG